MSLDRLINLARRTGDRLIVHNPMEDSDIVIMDVDEYESLLTDKNDVRSLSERQLLDKINRDIAIWRANDELESDPDEAADIFEKISDANDWHSTKNVLDDKYAEPRIDLWSGIGDDLPLGDYEEHFANEEKNRDESFGLHAFDKPDESEIEDYDMENLFPSSQEEDIVDNKESAQITVSPVPFIPNLGQDLQDWQEEPLLEDEPIFYEEPV